jgi:alpha-L-rhamnosidase
MFSAARCIVQLPQLWLLCGLSGSALAAQLTPASDLRVEHVGAIGTAPLGIEPASDVSPLRLWWALPSTPRGLAQQAHEIQLAQGAELLHGAGRVESGASEAVPMLAAGDVAPDSAYAVRVRYWAAGSAQEPSPWSDWLNFTTGLLAKADWGGAVWLAGDNSTHHPDVASQLRVSFEAQLGGLQRAQLFVGSRGYFKCWLNGEPVSDHEQGHTTTFEARTLYDTFPVQPLLQEGSNGLGCAVARGWYGEGGGMGTINMSDYQRSLILKLSLHYHNGSRSSVVSTSAGGWTTASGPYLNARIFSGVEYDARRETSGWTTSSYDESTSAVPWVKAKEDTTVPLDMQLRSAMTPFVRRTQTFRAVNFTKLGRDPEDPAAGGARYLYDFGQNAAAQMSLRIPAPADSRVSAVAEPDDVVTFALAFAETRPGSGQGGVANGSPIKFHTTLGRIAKDGVNWTAHFTYNGFQFCTLTVSSNSTDAANAVAAALPVPTIDTLVSHFTHSDVDYGRSSIGFNLPLLNQIQHLTRYASKSNLLDVPTDCDYSDLLLPYSHSICERTTAVRPSGLIDSDRGCCAGPNFN